MAQGRMDFSLQWSRGDEPAAPADADQPMRILVLADLAAAGQRQDFAARAPVAVDVDNLERVFSRFAPALRLTLAGEGGATETLALDFASLDDFHPDHLFRRSSAFGALRQLRDELQDPAGFDRAAAALGAPPQQAVPAAPGAAVESTADTVTRLLGRTPAAEGSGAAAQAIVGRLARELAGPDLVPDNSAAQAAVMAGLERAIGARMAAILHHPAFQALEASWRGVQRLATELELGESLQLQLLDVTRRELHADIMNHAADLSRSRLCALLCGEDTRPPEGSPWSLVVCDFSFGPGLDDVLLLAGLGALGAAAGAPVLAAATLDAIGCTAREDLPRPENWRPLASEDAARWAKLRQAESAPWIGLALPRVLGRLPYGARSDAVESFTFEEMEGTPRHGDFLWTNPAWALAVLIGQAFQEDGWPLDLERRLDIADLPSFAFRDAQGEAQQQPCAEVAMSETAAQAILARGIMPVLSYRNRNAARLLRWQSIADPAQGLGRL